jgi:hypothetical protein
MRITSFVNPLALSLCLVAATGTFAADEAAPAAASQKAIHGVPSFDIEAICNRVSDVVETPGGCTVDEQNARDQLGNVWTQYPSIERSRCTDLSTQGGLPSYVELLTCLEVARDAKNLSNE